MIVINVFYFSYFTYVKPNKLSGIIKRQIFAYMFLYNITKIREIILNWNFSNRHHLLYCIVFDILKNDWHRVNAVIKR